METTTMTAYPMNTKILWYSELITFNTFEERFKYAKLAGIVGNDTFGFDRYMNQMFYKSREWKNFRDFIITRDLGKDLAMDGYEIGGPITIHHLNPINPDDIKFSTDKLFDPENVVCVSAETHKFIHYGGEDYLDRLRPTERTPHDTCPWKK